MGPADPPSPLLESWSIHEEPAPCVEHPEHTRPRRSDVDRVVLHPAHAWTCSTGLAQFLAGPCPCRASGRQRRRHHRKGCDTCTCYLPPRHRRPPSCSLTLIRHRATGRAESGLDPAFPSHTRRAPHQESPVQPLILWRQDRKSTRLNSSHLGI